MTRIQWLIKFAPFRSSWQEIISRGVFTMRGVRSPEARKHLSRMKLGDKVLFYRSQQDQAIVGLMEVSREAYPDPTSADTQWLTCDFIPIQTFPQPLSRDAIKNCKLLQSLPLLTRPRLAVMPLTNDEFTSIRNFL
jgi:predicted RNA-binding protein with PUA-like domain